ncbi:MAG: alpha-L-fucosidase [Clostridia bacterium]|nr:alpha-L-fucosidase [Clostridia bacterium]
MKKILCPNEQQIKWADCEVGVIIHLDMQVFEPSYFFRDNFDYQPDVSVFKPEKLDTDKWIEDAVSAGAKYAVLVAKHCSGFCLWPTKQHDYHIGNTPYKNGNGDIVGEFIASCKKYGVLPGLYYSVSCNAYYKVDNPGLCISGDKEEQKRYNDMVMKQLRELWTNYGELFEIWFDGGCLSPEQGGAPVAELLYKLQKDAIVFQGPINMGNGLRWVGNERGIAPFDTYATVDFRKESFDGMTEEENRGGDPYGNIWRPAESDIPGRDAKRSFMGGWFWKSGEDDAVFPAEELFNRYLDSVGRNTNFLIGMAINNEGLLSEADKNALKGFGELVEENFSKPLAILEGELTGDSYTLESTENAKYLVICEDIKYGERILSYKTDVGIEGKAIGHKRILPLPENTKKVTFTVIDKKDTCHIKKIALY